MKKIIKTVINVSFMSLLTLFPFWRTQATEINNSSNEYDSIYRYNALENKISFSDFIHNQVLFPDLENKGEEILLKNNELQDNFKKELQIITEKQNFSIEQIEDAVNVLKDRNEFKTFLIGNDLGILRFQLVQIKNQTILLSVLALKSVNSLNKIQIDHQVKLSKEEGIKVENLILEQENKFSLFGWFVNIL